MNDRIHIYGFHNSGYAILDLIVDENYDYVIEGEIYGKYYCSEYGNFIEAVSEFLYLYQKYWLNAKEREEADFKPSRDFIKEMETRLYLTVGNYLRETVDEEDEHFWLSPSNKDWSNWKNGRIVDPDDFDDPWNW